MSGVRQEDKYIAIDELTTEKDYTIAEVCRAIHICPASYYKWKKRCKSNRELENEAILEEMQTIYNEVNGIYGYRRLMIEYNARHNTNYNVKRFHRLAKIGGLQAVIRRKKPDYRYHYKEHIEDNILAREFYAAQSNEKWLSDVTEMRYGNGKKAFVSAIFDLGDKRIVAYEIGQSNNNPLVFATLDKAIEHCPDARPIFHSDRGFQYTSKIFQVKLQEQGMVQSMSRAGKCIDNGPMEGFWSNLKTEMYYLHTFDDYESLVQAIEEYMHFYNYRRRQKKLDNLPPMEYAQRKAGTFI